MIQAVKVPEIGENVESGVVVAVHVSVGDRVAVDDTVIELETDKALVEIPSPYEGRVTEVLAETGTQLNVGDVIARLETDAGGAEEKSPAPPADEKKDKPARQKQPAPGSSPETDTPETEKPTPAEVPQAEGSSGSQPTAAT